MNDVRPALVATFASGKDEPIPFNPLYLHNQPHMKNCYWCKSSPFGRREGPIYGDSSKANN